MTSDDADDEPREDDDGDEYDENASVCSDPNDVQLEIFAACDAQWKSGARAEGAVYSTASFFQKLGKAFGGAGAGFALGLAGFAANRDQSPESLWAILALLTLAPATIMLAIAVAARFYHLDAETHARIVSELKQRGHLS